MGKRNYHLIQRKEVWVPTWKGWLSLSLVLVVLVILTAQLLYPFLSTHSPQRGGVLVIDGSLPDYAIEASMEVFEKWDCQMMITTGGPVPVGSYHQRFDSYAEIGKVKLVRMGFDSLLIEALPGPFVIKDRTYTNALTLKNWIDQKTGEINTINVLTIGPHARRSRLLFDKAFDEQYTMGIISVRELSYNQNQWWKSSIGFRTVISELIAYLYVKCFFFPENNPTPDA